jgi:hypothetical protein
MRVPSGVFYCLYMFQLTWIMLRRHTLKGRILNKFYAVITYYNFKAVPFDVCLLNMIHMGQNI